MFLRMLQYYLFLGEPQIMIIGFIPEGLSALFFIFSGLAIASFIKQARKSYSFIPYAPFLFFISIFIGYTHQTTQFMKETVTFIAKSDPRGLLIIFLPPLIFQSSFNADWYIFRKQSFQIFLLAFPSVLLSAIFIMLSVKAIYSDSEVYSWPQAFMFGSVLSCTDTVAVLALLKEAGAPRKFSSLIEGQSLFNDGTCMVLFTISFDLVGGNGSFPNPVSLLTLFIELTGGALVVGVIFGFLSAKIINFVSNDAILTLNITVVACYILYFIAEYVDFGFRISGIMALVSMGLYMAAFGKSKIPVESKQKIDDFWKVYIFCAETIIFILGGVIVGYQATTDALSSNFSFKSFGLVFLLYLAMMASRFLSIIIFYSKLKSSGYGIKFTQVLALTYGGLRGAVGIAFTLILASNQHLRPQFKSISLLNTSGCAFLTLLINAPTAGFVVSQLGLCKKSDTQERIFKKFMRETHKELTQKLQNEIKQNKYLSKANWDYVYTAAGLEELKALGAKIKNDAHQSSSSDRQLKEIGSIKQALIRETVLDDSDPGTKEEVRHRFCLILKGIMWEKFENNQCSSQSIRVLNQCINLDMDSYSTNLNSWDYLLNHFEIPYYIQFCYWLMNKPLVGSFGHSLIYDRVSLQYDVISTYIECLKQAQETCKLLPFGEDLQRMIIHESQSNRNFAQTYLDDQIKNSYEDIMKGIQTTKACYSILSYQKKELQNSYQYGEIDDVFSKQINKIIHNSEKKLENDSNDQQSMQDLDFLIKSPFFNQLPPEELNSLLDKKIDLLILKNQLVVKPYEKHRYVYLVTKGEIIEKYSLNQRTIYQRSIGICGIAGIGSLLNPDKKIRFHAHSNSVVRLFCFQMDDIKKLMERFPNIESIFYKSVFLFHICLFPNITQGRQMKEADLKRKQHAINFKRLINQEEEEYVSGKVFLLEGKIMTRKQQAHEPNIYEIKSSSRIMGPARFYFTNIILGPEIQEISENGDMMMRLSSARNRLSNKQNMNNQGIIRRTIFTKD